jgi:hypothetical protein
MFIPSIAISIFAEKADTFVGLELGVIFTHCMPVMTFMGGVLTTSSGETPDLCHIFIA